MIKPERLKKGDKVAIVSLSSGILGEKFVVHELDLGVKRLKEFGLEPVFMKNSRMRAKSAATAYTFAHVFTIISKMRAKSAATAHTFAHVLPLITAYLCYH